MIAAKGLTKLYDGIHGISNIDFSIRDGEIFGFLGQNGAGKTTSIKIMTGLLKPDSGIVNVGGYDVLSEPDRVRKIIGYLPESFGLYDDLTAYEILDYTAKLYRIEKSARKERITSLLSKFDLTPVKDKKVGSFSKGMRQKVAFARALLNDPEVLFLDEPTSGLDPQAARQIEELIAELKNEGKTVFITSHVLSEVEKVCDSIAIIKQGTIRASGSIEDMKKRYSTPAVLVRVSDAPINMERAVSVLGSLGAGGMEVLDDEVRVYTKEPDKDTPLISKTLAVANIPVLEIKMMELSLEDIYFKVMEE